ncbi:MAG: Omp85 family outer membrane protein [Bacteroidota bacterium]
MHLRIFLSIIGLASFLFLSAQQDTTESEIKKGWNVGILPVVSFDSDLGFKYGGLTNIYDYGDGSLYPEYKHSIYLEISRTTKGSGINQLFYDSKKLFSGREIRVTADISYLTEKALDFYGFNGYESVYDPDMENKNSSTRMFYRLERQLLRTTLDVQFPINKKFRALLGAGHFNVAVDDVDINALNKDLEASRQLSDTSLYQHYIDKGWIDAREKDGGTVNYFKGGLIYDTRDNEPNPMNGMFTEAILFAAPSWFGTKEHPYTKLALTHRQYFTLVPKKLSLVYRINYQSTIAGKAPFYMESPMILSFSPNVSNEALGGAKTLRGVLRQRIVGEGYVFANFETRWKFVRFRLINQNFYLALSGFYDVGQTTRKRETGNADESIYLSEDKESLHHSLGAGFHAAMNENFILAVDYGRALDKRDGKQGIYFGMNWLF